MRRHIGALTIAAAMALGTVAPTGAQEDVAPADGAPPSEVVACPDFSQDIGGGLPTILESEVEGETYECGVVTVPEDHADPGSREIELFYVRLFSTGDAPDGVPMFYLAGGPGQAGTTGTVLNANLGTNFGLIRESRDVIAYDQRGTGRSDYTVCAPFIPAVDVVAERSTDDEVQAAIETIRSSDTFNGGQALCGLVHQYATDVDLAQYNSISSAQDIAAIATALGYEDGYDLYGASYGTRLAQLAMRETPDAIRSVVLDGVVGLDISNVAGTINKRGEQYDTIFELCAADDACAAAYPDLQARFADLLERLAAEPIELDEPIVVNPLYVQYKFSPPVLTNITPDFFIALSELMNQSRGGVATALPLLIDSIEQGDIEAVRETMSTEGAVEPVPAAVQPTTELPFDRPSFGQPIGVLLSLAQAEAQMSADDRTLGDEWVFTVVDDLLARLEAGEAQADIVAAVVELALLPTEGPDAAALTDFADRLLSPEAATAANSLVEQMDRATVRETLWNVQDIAFVLGNPPDARLQSTGMQFAVNCSEDVAFRTVEDMQAAQAEAPYPQLQLAPVEFLDTAFLQPCALFPPTVLDESVVERLESDIPTLVINGGMDIQTPLSWARHVADGLDQSYFVEFPTEGHVVAGMDETGCVGSIAAAFLSDPAQAPDTSCAQGERFTIAFRVPG